MSKNRPMDVHVFFTEGEYDLLTEKMRRFGIRNRSAFIRKMAVDGLCVRLDLPELRQMTTMLSRCGNNLNQVAKVANATGTVDQAALKNLQTQFDGIRETADRILALLMKVPGLGV